VFYLLLRVRPTYVPTYTYLHVDDRKCGPFKDSITYSLFATDKKAAKGLSQSSLSKGRLPNGMSSTKTQKCSVHTYIQQSMWRQLWINVLLQYYINQKCFNWITFMYFLTFPGLPDLIFPYQKSKVFLKALKYIFWYILWTFGTYVITITKFCGHLV
jgi:hypothetical protein